jgi:phospholipid-binding lipoprotein MlaA
MTHSMGNPTRSYLAFFATLLLLAACSGPAERDRYESVNRSVFIFNETLDAYLLKPVAQGYRFITPDPLIWRLRNASRNLSEPVTMLNAFLQGDVKHGIDTFWRFTINSTLGLAGMHDIAGQAGIHHRSEDFGQTLAVWGVESGDYVMLPVFGPSTTRDAFGLVVDIVTSPFTYIPEDDGAAIGIGLADAIIRREALINPIEDIYETSFDPYTSFRSIYLQRRDAEINNRHNGRAPQLGLKPQRQQ